MSIDFRDSSEKDVHSSKYESAHYFSTRGHLPACFHAGHLDAAEALVRRGADVDARHGHGGSALVEAATAGATDVLALLVAEGADPRVVDDDGVTALMRGACAPS